LACEEHSICERIRVLVHGQFSLQREKAEYLWKGFVQFTNIIFEEHPSAFVNWIGYPSLVEITGISLMFLNVTFSGFRNLDYIAMLKPT
ncbi:MAG: hypothetical protein J0651_05585, partial [Actinobacteria bacterium]|nr:hypothetical protein [Actinomycetota bacterium]